VYFVLAAVEQQLTLILHLLHTKQQDGGDLKGGDSASISRFSTNTGSDAGGSNGGGGGILTPPSIRTLSTLQATLLAFFAAVSWAVACSGACLLAWLLISRMYLPGEIEWHRPLYFDYGTSLSTAIALVPLTHSPDTAPGGVLADPSAPGDTLGAWTENFPLSPHAGGGGAAAAPQLLLAPGRRASVSVQLRLPPAVDQDLFQVTGELLTADGKLLGRSARTHVPRPRALVPRMIHYFVTAPWAAIGLYDTSEHVELLLFDSFGVPSAPPPRRKSRRGSSSSSAQGDPEQAARVPAYFRAKLVGRSPAEGPPRIYSADMRLKLKLGEPCFGGEAGGRGCWWCVAWEPVWVERVCDVGATHVAP